MENNEDRPKRRPVFLVKTEGMTADEMKAAAREALRQSQEQSEDPQA